MKKRIGDSFWSKRAGKGVLVQIKGNGHFAEGLVQWENGVKSWDYLDNLRTFAEVLIKGEWVRFDMAGDITPKSKEWYASLNIPLKLIAEGEYPVRYMGHEDGTRTLCFYQEVLTDPRVLNS